MDTDEQGVRTRAEWLFCPWAISRITAAALVILPIEHGRTT